MKRVLYFLAFFLVAGAFHSCGGEEEVFDESLLIGKWEQKSGPPPVLFYRYDSNGNGVTWNPDEGYTELNGQKFTWRLIKSELTQIHLMESGTNKIKFIFTVTELTSTTLKYKDELSRWSFTKL